MELAFGLRVWRLRSERVGFVVGMVTAAGAMKMTFSAFPATREAKYDVNRRTRVSMVSALDDAFGLVSSVALSVVLGVVSKEFSLIRCWLVISTRGLT
jgi:hypothetical protein